MEKCMIRGLMTNLKTWIRIERNPVFRTLYVEYYNELKEKLEKLDR